MSYEKSTLDYLIKNNKSDAHDFINKLCKYPEKTIIITEEDERDIAVFSALIEDNLDEEY